MFREEPGGAPGDHTHKSMENVVITHIHLNDNTLAGFKIKNKNIFSVQFHPESSAGPKDSRYLLDYFINTINMAAKKKKEVSNP